MTFNGTLPTLTSLLPLSPIFKIARLTLLSLLIPFAITTAQAQCGPGDCKGPNLVYNGNFEIANPNPNNPINGFSSDFNVVVCPTASIADLWGSVTVINDATMCYNEWTAIDHSLANGTGSMLVADFPDSNPDGTNNYMDIWASTVAVEPGKTYCFGAWFINMNDNPNKPKPNFRYMVDDSLVGISPELQTNAGWEYFAFTITVPAGVHAMDIALQNGKFGGEGNDLAIDDIEFSELVSNSLPPTAQNDEAVMGPGAVNFPINVLANDFVNDTTQSLDITTLTLTSLPGLNEGSVTINQYGELLFTPSWGFLGTTTFTYEICQTGGCCTSAIVTVSVDNILPTDIDIFRAELISDHGLLEWMTVAETNNSHFEIERSFDSEVFESIGEVIGSGTTNNPENYQFRDYDVFKQNVPMVYYRLKQIDFDGTFTYSSTIVLTLETNDVVNFVAYPNPGNKFSPISLDYTNETGKDLTLRVLNVNGQIVHESIVGGSVAQPTLQLDLSHLTSGLYLISLGNKHSSDSQRIIITD